MRRQVLQRLCCVWDTTARGLPTNMVSTSSFCLCFTSLQIKVKRYQPSPSTALMTCYYSECTWHYNVPGKQWVKYMVLHYRSPHTVNPADSNWLCKAWLSLIEPSPNAVKPIVHALSHIVTHTHVMHYYNFTIIANFRESTWKHGGEGGIERIK